MHKMYIIMSIFTVYMHHWHRPASVSLSHKFLVCLAACIKHNSLLHHCSLNHILPHIVSTRHSTKYVVLFATFRMLQRQSLPVRATRRGKQRRLARTISSMGSRPGHGVSRPQYRNSNTPRMQAVLVLGMDTWKMTRSRQNFKKKHEKRRAESQWRELMDLIGIYMNSSCVYLLLHLHTCVKIQNNILARTYVILSVIAKNRCNS